MIGAKRYEPLTTQGAVTDGYRELTKWVLAGFSHSPLLATIWIGLVLTLNLSAYASPRFINCSQQAASCHHPELDQSGPRPPIKLFHVFRCLSAGFLLRLLH